MDKKIRWVWLAILAIALVEALVGFLPEYIGAILPVCFLSLSFYVFRKLPLGYRIFHLFFIAQFLLYAIFVTLTSYGKLFGGGWEAALAYSPFKTMIFVYMAFLLLLLLVYAPYFFLRKRKPAAS